MSKLRISSAKSLKLDKQNNDGYHGDNFESYFTPVRCVFLNFSFDFTHNSTLYVIDKKHDNNFIETCLGVKNI